MSLHPLVAAALALFGNFILSLGMVLQKRHVAWIGRKGGKDDAYRRDRAGWLAGFVLMNIVPIFNYLALLGLPANVVGAAAGANVAFTALLASVMLGERLGARRALWSVLMFVSMALAVFRGGVGAREPSSVALYAFLGAPIFAGAAGVALRHRRIVRGHMAGGRLAVALASAAGSLGGYMVLPMRALQLGAGAKVLAWFASPFLYLYIVAGVCAFSLVQLAYKDGEMASVSPAYYGMQVLWPAFAAYFVLGSPFDPFQAAAFAAIAACVSFIARESPVSPSAPLAARPSARGEK